MIKCQFVNQSFYSPSNGYTVAVYRTGESHVVPPEAVKDLYGTWVTFTAVGTELPCIDDVEIELEGKWTSHERFGAQFLVEWSKVLLPKTNLGIISYLSSMIDGIGPVLAKEIVDRFGGNTFDIISQEPERLLEIKGITETKLQKIKDSYGESAELRELVTFLAPYKVTPKKAEKIWEHFGMDSVAILKENPYRLCEIKGFGFLTVDPIACASNGYAPDATERIKASMHYVLKEAEKDGHLFLESAEIVKRARKLLNQGFAGQSVSANAVKRAGNDMVLVDQHLEADGNAIFLKENRYAEIRAVKHLKRLLRVVDEACDIERDLEEVQAEYGIILAEKQKDAVRRAFESPVSIITGGPGKGKTTVLGILLRIFERREKGKQILLCAPTGRARKRLSESSGYPAMTIHKALYLMGEDGEETIDDGSLDEDLIIADEFTMADMKLASILFAKIKDGAKLVLVGDVDQLPSVGPGNVFKELIESGQIPVTVLDIFFRQAQDSRIILNADLINRNQISLHYGDDFQFLKAESDEEAADIIEAVYERELKAYDGDVNMIQVLSPLRKNTMAGVNALNQSLQAFANPQDPYKGEWNHGDRTFRVGDKVMQTQNLEEVSNGDVGIILDLGRTHDGSFEMKVSFGDTERIYKEDELSMLDHAYATSIHKSQGGEFPVVIIPVLKCFYPMLKRNVYYTGITRARKKVYLVGEKQALAMAISCNDMSKRNTLLAYRLQKELKNGQKRDIRSAA